MSDFVSWAQEYFRHKDIMKQSILIMNIEDEHLVIEYKDGKKDMVLCSENLLPASAFPTGYNKVYFVGNFTKKNLELLINNWQAYIDHPQLTVMFVDVKANRRWMVAPFFHHKISHDNTRKSLETLYTNA